MLLLGLTLPSSGSTATHATRRSSQITGEIYALSLATGKSHALGPGASPALAPQGRQIAYLHDGQIWLMATDGNDQRQLTQQGGGPPTWSPDGSRLVYTRWNLDNCFPGATKCAITDLWTVGVDGTDEHKLVDLALSPAWSPDGRRLLYRRFVGPAEAGLAAGDLELARADGTHLRTVGFGKTWDGTRQLPAWSPNGRWIAYERTMWSGEHRLLVVRPDGSGGRRLPNGSSPAWSPDGKLLAFERKTGIFVVPFAGGPARRVSSSGSCPTWSPRGKRLAFVTTHYPTGGTLSIVDRDGRHRRNLATAAFCFLPYFNDFPSPPRWSLDGRSLFYAG